MSDTPRDRPEELLVAGGIALVGGLALVLAGVGLAAWRLVEPLAIGARRAVKPHADVPGSNDRRD